MRRLRVRSNGRTGRTDGTMKAGFVMVFLDLLGEKGQKDHAVGYYPQEIEYLEGGLPDEEPS